MIGNCLYGSEKKVENEVQRMNSTENRKTKLNSVYPNDVEVEVQYLMMLKFIRIKINLSNILYLTFVMTN